MKRTGVIVAVESYMLRKGVVTILNRVAGITVIREFEAAIPLQRFMPTRNRDLLVISQSLFDQLGHLLFNNGDLQERTIILTQGNKTEAERGIPAIDAGDNKDDIINTIQDLIEAQPQTPGESYLFNLSPREKTIVRLVSLGYTNKQIAEELFLSAHTVITHRKNIGHKLGIKSVSGLTVYAIVNNIITIEEVNSNPV